MAEERAAGLPATRTNVDPSLRLAPGTLLAGRYEIRAILGAGGMGVVYRAFDRELSIEVALKVLRPELGADAGAVERFRRELRLAREVSHRQVVRIHDIGEHEGMRFLTMQFVEGRSLREILERDGRLPVEKCVAIVRDLAEGLAAAHAAGIVHRDLKPANVLIDSSGRATITDFGVARSFAGDGLTRAGAIVGTPEYLSPEQIAGDAVDGRADLYALGLVFYEMLSGELPFRSGSQAETLAQRLAGRARDISETGVRVSPRLRAVLRKCLESRPSRRYPDARALLADLDAASTAGGSRRGRRVAAAVAVAAAALAGAALLLPRVRKPPSPRAAAPSPVLARHALAVLPLADESGDASLAWTKTGVAEMLAADLSESPRLRVLDSMRVLSSLRDLHFSAPFDDRSVRELARLWGVDRIVAGSLRKAGERLRIDLRLVALDAGGAVRSEFVSGEAPAREGLFGSVTGLAAALRSRLGVPDAPRPAPDREAASLEAARAYEEGRLSLARGDEIHAAPAFERAAQLDPRFAAAYERLAQTQQALGFEEKALAAGERALQLAGSRPSRLAYRVRARVALLKGKPEEAEKSYAELVRLYPSDVEPRLDLAAAQAAQGHSAAAVATLQKAVETDPNDPRGWFLLGKNSILAGDSGRAVKDYLVRALALQTQLGNEKGRGDVLNAIGVASQQLGDYPRALENYTEASRIRATVGDDRGAASTLRNRASVSLALGRPADAEADLDRARALFDRIGDRAGSSDVANDFGVLHEGRGDFGKALPAYQEALRIRRGLGDERLLAQSYDNVGYIFYLQGEYDNALVYWQQALDLRRKIGDKNGVVLSEQNLGFLQTAQGKWEEAVKTFLDALQKSREIDFANGVAISLGNLGMLNHYRGRYAAAFDSFREALDAAAKLDWKPTQAEFTTREGEALLDLGRFDEVAERISRAEKWIGGTGNREQLAELEILRGRWQRARGSNEDARRSLSRAVGLAKQSGGKAVWLRARIAASEASRSTFELERELAEARALGHALRRVEAAEALAAAELARGRLPASEKAVREALETAEEAGWGAGLYRLHALLGKIRQASGDAAGAREAFTRSAREIAELRAGLSAAHRPAFDALPEVREAAARGTAGAPR